MRKLLCLFTILLGIGTAQAANFDSSLSSYNICIKSSNKLNSPDLRDTKKVSCFKKHKNILNSNACIKLASILEYTSIADELLSLCLDSYGIDANKCVKIASHMNYGENADLALWSCVQLESSKRNKAECLKIAKNMTFPHNKVRAKELCLYQSEK